MNQEVIQKLKAPFPFEEVEAKVQVTNQDKTKGMAVFYIDSRVIQNRLDDALGPMNWKNSFTDWKSGQAQLCGIAIYDSERKEWISKYDGSDNSEIEPVKGGLSDSFKRAACVWGIGRFLYSVEPVWVEVEQRGKGTYIKDSQQNILKTAYDKAVAHIFGTAAPQNGTPANVPNKPAQSPAQQSASSSTTPTTPQTAKESPAAPPSAPPVDEPIYQIKDVKPSGTSSQVLELIDNQGEKLTVYVKAGNEAIKPGVRLRDMKIEQRKSEYGEFNIVSAYQVAA